MYLCYIDESGNPELTGTTSHYVLAGLAIPIYHWKTCETEINRVKLQYDLLDAEIHTGWLIRNYTEQNKIPGFDAMSYPERKSEVEKYRRSELFNLQKSHTTRKKLLQTKKNYIQTKDYIHLTFQERRDFVLDIAKTIGNWGFARLFVEAIDKVHFDPKRAPSPIDEQGLEQVVSRFEQYLSTNVDSGTNYGLLIHDNNQTVAKRHTQLMKEFHKKGTVWTLVNNIIETPLFVDSSLTSMIQMADVCAYSVRRYLENNEELLFNEVMKRAHRRGNVHVGVRHFAVHTCPCKICQFHKHHTTPLTSTPTPDA